jgi:preprotein translocase subunit Sec63
MRQIRELRRERTSIFSSIRLGPMIPYCPPVYIIRCLCCCSLYIIWYVFISGNGWEQTKQQTRARERPAKGKEKRKKMKRRRRIFSFL